MRNNNTLFCSNAQAAAKSAPNLTNNVHELRSFLDDSSRDTRCKFELGWDKATEEIYAEAERLQKSYARLGSNLNEITNIASEFNSSYRELGKAMDDTYVGLQKGIPEVDSLIVEIQNFATQLAFSGNVTTTQTNKWSTEIQKDRTTLGAVNATITEASTKARGQEVSMALQAIDNVKKHLDSINLNDAFEQFKTRLSDALARAKLSAVEEIRQAYEEALKAYDEGLRLPLCILICNTPAIVPQFEHDGVFYQTTTAIQSTALPVLLCCVVIPTGILVLIGIVTSCGHAVNEVARKNG